MGYKTLHTTAGTTAMQLQFTVTLLKMLIKHSDDSEVLKNDFNIHKNTKVNSHKFTNDIL